MRARASTAAVLVVLAVFFWFRMHATGGLYYLDFQSFAKPAFPSDAEWQAILDNHRSEISDGREDKVFLDRSFVGGWNKCFTNFVTGVAPWDYVEVLSDCPLMLGGNMHDTDRIAGNLGWISASEAIKKQLQFESINDVRSRVRYINPRAWASVFLGLLFLIVIVQKYQSPSESMGEDGP